MYRPPGPPTRTVAAVMVSVCLLAILGGVATADEQVIGSPDVEVVTPENELEPGATTTLDVSLANAGSVSTAGPTDFVERVTTARGTTMTVEDAGTPLTVETGTYPVGRVPPGTAGPFPIRVTVPEDAEPGTYELPVRLRYAYTSIVTYDQTASGPTNVEYDDSFRERRATLTVRVADDPRFSITNVTSTARVGGQGTVSMTVTNRGPTSARSASLSIASDSGELTFGTGTAESSGYLGRLGPGESTVVTYTVHTSEDATVRPYTLTGRVSYEDTDGIAGRSQPLTASLAPAPEWTFTITNVTDTTQVGDSGRVAVTVRNDGLQAARAASLTVESPTDAVTFDGGSPTATGNLGVLDPGETRRLAYRVTVAEDVERRPYTITGRVDYEDAAGTAARSDPLTVAITPAREQAFGIRSVESALRVGDDGTVSGRLVNRGPETARRPVVVLDTPGSTIEVTEPEFALPTLDPGESARFRFDVAITDSADAGKRQFSFRVRYRNQAGDVRESDALDRRVTVGPQRDRFTVEPLDDSVTAGDGTTLRLRVTNTEDRAVEDVTMKAYPNDPLASEDDEAYVGRLGAGESTVVTVGMRASEGAAAKEYPLSVDFEYTDESGETQLSDAITVGVAVRQAGSGGAGAAALLVGLAVLVGSAGLYYWRRR